MVTYLGAIVVVVVCTVLTVFTSGGLVWMLLDLPTFFSGVLFPFLFQWVLFGGKTLKIAFAAGSKKPLSLEELKTGEFFFKTYAKTTWVFALIGVLIGVLSTLINLEDKAALGPNMAVALLSVIYAGLSHLLIILPNAVFIKKRLLATKGALGD